MRFSFFNVTTKIAVSEDYWFPVSHREKVGRLKIENISMIFLTFILFIDLRFELWESSKQGFSLKTHTNVIVQGGKKVKHYSNSPLKSYEERLLNNFGEILK